MNKNPYFVAAAESLGESVYEYLNKTKFNYVIVEGTKPLTWKGEEESPVIFGDFGEVANELSNWATPIHNISIITEEEYIKDYLGNAWNDWYNDPNNTIMDEGNGHDKEVVRQINDAWKKNREMFYGILCALYRRDIDEITDHDSFREPKWEETEEYNKGVATEDWTDYNNMVLDLMIKEWDFYAYNYLMHIADDIDLRCILNFLHYPYLPIYGIYKD